MLYTGAARGRGKAGALEREGRPIEYRRQKTVRTNGVLVSIPIRPDLAEVLATLPDDRPFLATACGKARSPDGLGNKTREWCDQSGLSACSAYGLRKACARRLAEAGATAYEIMAVTGHKSLAEVQRYTESAMREGLANQAMRRLLSRSNREQTVVNLPSSFATKSSNPMI